MFCFQCQEAAKGIACTLKGVCGKNNTTSAAMDLLLFVVRGVSVVADVLHDNGMKADNETCGFVTDALFSTITNANFDEESILARVDKGLVLRNRLIQKAEEAGIALPKVDELSWQGSREVYKEKAQRVGVLRETDADLRSLKELVLYGLKGMEIGRAHV